MNDPHEIWRDVHQGLRAFIAKRVADEAAARLGLSVSGMKSRVQRGRRQLRDMLETCCAIALDRRGGVADYDLRDQQNDPCGGSSDCS